MARTIFKTSRREDFKSIIKRIGFNFFPAYRRTGGRILFISNDYKEVHIKLSLNWTTKNHTVWTTGDLLNGEDVFEKEVFKRYQTAHVSDQVVDVIDSSDLTQNKVTKPNQFNTFKFEAKNVVDFAFATSNHYSWKSASLIVDSVTKRRTRVDAVFNAKHRDYYKVIDFARKTVETMSFRFPKWPFPYSHETIFCNHKLF